jgi:aminopeptidase N
VTGLNLTRDEARERARLLDVESYEVRLDLASGDKTFRSDTLARFHAREPGATVRIDLAAETVRSVALNGEELDPFEITASGGLTISGLAAENELRIIADCTYMHTGEGMHRFVDPVDGEVYLYTQFEANEAHRVYACFDQPDLKAVFSLTVDAPEHWTVLSNEPVTSSEPLREGVRRISFAPTPKVSTYITVICAGPFYGVTDSYVRADGSTIPLGLYCRASLGQYMDPAELIELTQQGFAFFEQQFGQPYPFTKYDQVGVAEFNAGAMENSGCVTFHEDYFVFRSKVTDALRDTRANTLLHEMAHMWFGDLVTMKWWDDLWLNESFAEFMAYHLDVVRHRAEGLGLPTGPAALHAPDRRRRTGHRDGEGQLRRHHLRQGGVGPAPARGLGRGRGVHGRASRVLRQARVGQHDARRPARRAGGDVGPRPHRLVQGMAGDGRLQHVPPRVDAGRRRHVRERLDPAGGARRPSDAALAPDRCRPLRPRG